MNKQLSVMGLAARASMVPVLIAAGLTALAVGALTYLANPEHTGGAAGVGAAPLAAAVGYLMVMVMLCLGGCGFGSQTAYTVRRLRLREELVDLWWAAYHAAMLLVLWALVATAALLGMQLKLQGLESNWGVGPQSLMLLVYSDSLPAPPAAAGRCGGMGDRCGAADGQCTGGGPVHPEPAAGTAEPVAGSYHHCHPLYLYHMAQRRHVDDLPAGGAGHGRLHADPASDRR